MMHLVALMAIPTRLSIRMKMCASEGSEERESATASATSPTIARIHRLGESYAAEKHLKNRSTQSAEKGTTERAALPYLNDY